MVINSARNLCRKSNFPRITVDRTIIKLSVFERIRYSYFRKEGCCIILIVDGGVTSGEKKIQKIELPENRENPVAKYNDVVLAYARY